MGVICLLFIICRVFNVPLGVEIVAENNVLLARCSRLKQLYLVAQGGMGGCANNNFKAEKGEAFSMTVNLKLNPNVGLIGFPNAGKSTLMQALVPNKHVNIAAYPFTTTLPQLCYIKYGDKRRTTAADENDTEDTGGGAVTMEEKAAVCEPSQELSAANREKWEEEEEKHLVGMPFTLSIADLPGIVEGASRNRLSREIIPILDTEAAADDVAGPNSGFPSTNSYSYPSNSWPQKLPQLLYA
uniref:G domain-containing protein n=1 Tax=Globodera pallida TaxID=36090 RepID=A0A183CEI1_GLOPA